jgi:hypothetical protein
MGCIQNILHSAHLERRANAYLSIYAPYIILNHIHEVS